MSREELKAEMQRLGGGTPQELADGLGHPRDGSFKRALAELVDEGVFVARGSTVDRFYVLGEDVEVAEAPADPLLACLPCSAQEFSEVGHGLGLRGGALGARKLSLQIETFERDGQWFCRHAPGYRLVGRAVSPAG